jgi:hypothetical protein
MKVVEYPRSLRWVSDVRCRGCATPTPAWHSSDISEMFPHFYCDRCSNVIHRRADQKLAWPQATPAILDTIAATLPACPCGGQFRPGQWPKCPHCGTELAGTGDPVKRLQDPFVIVLDGACVFRDWAPPYRVRILELE